jgi:homoserine kinase
MTFRDRPVRVRVPATSANLGPGYDSFGLALDRHDEVTAWVTERGLLIELADEAEELALDETHLVVRSMRACFELLGSQPPGLRLHCLNRIPHGRGLGSSAAAIVAGVQLARGLHPDGDRLLDDAGMLALATELEGHPDNVAACLLGGLTIAWLADGVGRAIRLNPTGISPVLFIPPGRSATRDARAILPEQVPQADAAFNLGRAALLPLALTGRPELLLAATEDRLHQGYRAEGMPASLELVERLRAQLIAAVVSGAGPTVLALAVGDQAAAAVASCPAGWECVTLSPADGARTEILPIAK